MTEPNEQGHGENSTDNTPITAKKSVVDDFFSALFANNNKGEEPTAPSSPKAEAAAAIVEVKQEPKYNTSHYHDKDQADDSIHINRKRERVLDEFDEYNLLSSKRRDSGNKYKSNDIEENRPILSKKDIDWSNVKPESRMLVRFLPKSIDKQVVVSHFSKYGEVLEVVQKTPYGFVHFENPDACARAVQAENGQIFHGITLDLEICKRKPFFARNAERKEPIKHNIDFLRHRRDSPPPLPQQQQNNRNRNNYNKNGRYPQASPPPPRRGSNNYNNNVNGYHGGGGRRNDFPSSSNRQQNEYRPDYPDYNNGYYRSDRSDNTSTSPFVRQEHDTYRPHQQRQQGYNNNGRPPANAATTYRDDNPRNNNYKYDSYSRYNDNTTRYNDHNSRFNGQKPPVAAYPSAPAPNPSPKNTNAVIIPRRQGSEIPMVQIVSWDNVAYGYTDYIERVLSTNGIRSSSMSMTYSPTTREQIVKQMILEGVKAIIMIDHQNELQNKVYLQVFAPSEYNGQAIRFDEYDSVTALEAVNIFYRMYPPTTTGAPQAVISPPSVAAPVQQQQQQQPAGVDMNTLASLYNMLQQQQQQPVVGVSPPVVNQATVPQLLATLVNGLSMQPQQQQQPVAVSPQVTHPYPQPTQDNNNIAALISTAAGGNPALAQLLAQMTTSVGANSNELHK